MFFIKGYVVPGKLTTRGKGEERASEAEGTDQKQRVRPWNRKQRADLQNEPDSP